MDNWETIKADEIIQFNPTETIKRGTIAKKIAMEKLEPFTRDISGFELAEFKSGTKFRNGDTLLARITPCLENGKTSKVTILDEKEVAFGSTEFIVMRAKEGISDEDYIYYLSRSPYWREIAIKSMVGSSGRQRVQLDVLKNTKLSIPSLEEQREIGKILRSIDEKIENNRKINHHLAEMAESIWKEKYANLKPNSTLGNFFPIITGKKDANVARGGQYPFFSCSQGISYTDAYSFEGNAILLAGNGDFNVKTYNGKFEAYQRTYVLIPNNEYRLGFLYYAIKHFLSDITAGDRGSVIKYITKGDIENLNLYMPDDESDFELFNQFVSNTAQNNAEIERLTETRDTLLPKLMSGELSVID
ncbi:TPA: restriction endonuclease subunit S [Enterococcus faecium]|uniref:restriction endonuclease subunit S n=1 Tax=Lactobacillales TaxID=186826 RepID=UPI0022E2F5BD|nr:restriction endonuclease subunit S [Enterococcus lactis]